MKYTFDGTALRADGVTVAIAVGGFDTAPILLRHARAGAALEGQGLGEGRRRGGREAAAQRGGALAAACGS